MEDEGEIHERRKERKKEKKKKKKKKKRGRNKSDVMLVIVMAVNYLNHGTKSDRRKPNKSLINANKMRGCFSSHLLCLSISLFSTFLPIFFPSSRSFFFFC